MAVLCEDNWEESSEKMLQVLCFICLFKGSCLCDWAGDGHLRMCVCAGAGGSLLTNVQDLCSCVHLYISHGLGKLNLRLSEEFKAIIISEVNCS